jgi:hypothetical protein
MKDYLRADVDETIILKQILQWHGTKGSDCNWILGFSGHSNVISVPIEAQNVLVIWVSMSNTRRTLRYGLVTVTVHFSCETLSYEVAYPAHARTVQLNEAHFN